MGNAVHEHGSDVIASAERGEPNLGWVVAGFSAAASVIHFALVPIHGGAGLTDPLGFAVVGWFQLIVAGLILADRASRRLYQVAIVGNLVVIGLWVWSRTVGLPIGSHKGIVEAVGPVDLLCVAFQVCLILVAARILLVGDERPATRRLAPALCAVAALGLATTAITSPDAATHNHGAAVDAVTAYKDKIDATRCDTGFNIPAYWSETKTLGIDTYQGGTFDPSGASAAASSAAPIDESQPHVHSAAGPVAVGGTTTTTAPDPTQGRGSAVLDQLVSDTANSNVGEGAAADLVVDLAKASSKDYAAWLWWLRASGNTAHAHSGTTSADGIGHGGHVGPQLWTAMTDKGQCDRLAHELAIARATAMKYPTVRDAEKAGYVSVTGYVPGIAAHFIKYDLIDGVFDIRHPEMILYDGSEPNSHVVGLSYYIWHSGTAEPTQGFTGFNDHGHQHVGLCQGKTGVVGDSNLTAAECAARGGFKDNSSNGWMYHAWVVPGCESPWGVFSAASPILDEGVHASSGLDGGHCAGSTVRKRYGLAPEKQVKPASSVATRVGSSKATTASGATSDKPQSVRSGH